MAIALIAALLLLGSQVQGRDRFQLGGAAGLPWGDWGDLAFIDAASVPGSIRPIATEPTQNLIATMRQRGGDVSSILDTYTLAQDWIDGGYEFVIDGDSTTAFVHPPRIKILGGGGGFWTVPMFFDLGAPFVVDRIRFMTRPDHLENRLRRYILYLNDGSQETKDQVGNVIWSKYREEIDNLSPAVDLGIEPQMVRHIYLLPGTIGSGGGLSETWEIAEMQVFGRGFVPAATFASRPIALSGPASLGAIHWAWHVDPGAQVIVQTRSGTDEQPGVYWRKTGVGDERSPLDERGRPLTAETYGLLRPNKRGGITDDLTNWSPWQTYGPVGATTGTQVLSPSPRAFVQVRVQFLSAGLAGGRLDSLWFDYSEPPIVRSAVGEIHPDLVEPAQRTPFTYVVRSRVDAGQSGFDALRLRTSGQVDTITAVRIDRAPVGFRAEAEGDGGIVVRFPRIRRDQTLLEIDLEARVYRYGTPFAGSVLDTEADEVPLEITPGDAAAEVGSDGLLVRIRLDNDLLAGLQVEPNPFSPNGDGTNDVATLSFSLLRLTEVAPVTLRIFDLAGRLVRRLGSAPAGSQSVALDWNGRDDAGALVTPGLYVFRLTVESDAGRQERVGAIAVAY